MPVWGISAPPAWHIRVPSPAVLARKPAKKHIQYVSGFGGSQAESLDVYVYKVCSLLSTGALKGNSVTTNVFQVRHPSIWITPKLADGTWFNIFLSLLPMLRLLRYYLQKKLNCKSALQNAEKF
jgi:hypothetical protein